MNFSTFRQRAVTGVISGLFTGLSSAARSVSFRNPAKHGVEVFKDVPYRSPLDRSGDHLLDVYRPAHMGVEPRPVVLHVHGGGFTILSKDTHWLMGMRLARMGYVVFNINYRLAPKGRFPLAFEDCADAYAWVVQNAHIYGGDISRFVLAGESAGGNLVSALALAAVTVQPDPGAHRVFESGVVPRAVVPICGMLQVSDVARHARGKKHSVLALSRMQKIEASYLPQDGRANFGLADPLLVAESELKALRPWPAFFLPCGTWDPVLDDTVRMGPALQRAGARAEVRLYAGEPHAFHALVFRKKARACWRDIGRFLDEVLGETRAVPVASRRA